MKKNLTLLPLCLLFTANCLLISCSNKSLSPEQVTLKFFDLLYNNHDIENAELLVTEASKEKLRNDFKFIEGALKIVEEGKEPTHYNYTVTKEKTELKNDSAFVFITSSLDTAHMKILLLQLNEEWKIDFNYDANAFNPTTKELVDDVLQMMEGFVDSVTIGNDTLSVK